MHNYAKLLTGLRASLLDHLTEYKVELASSTDNIAAQASEHIHTNEIILTVGKSTTVERFLKTAARTRSLQVIVVEGAPLYHVIILVVMLLFINDVITRFILILGSSNGGQFGEKQHPNDGNRRYGGICDYVPR